MRFRWFFSVLKAVSLRMTYKFQNVYDCRKNWLSLLKQSKQLLHFILLMKRWSALNILKKIIVYYDNNWFLQRKKILWKEKQKVRAAMITNGSENPINVIFWYDLFYLTRTAYGFTQSIFLMLAAENDTGIHLAISKNTCKLLFLTPR